MREWFVAATPGQAMATWQHTEAPQAANTASQCRKGAPSLTGPETDFSSFCRQLRFFVCRLGDLDVVGGLLGPWLIHTIVAPGYTW